VSLVEAYPKRLRDLAKKHSRKLKNPIHEGVYLALPGPSYETPAEVKMFRLFGADAAGMSTVPEVTAAVQLGVSVLAISLITNVHTRGSSPDHSEVLETAKKSEKKFCKLLREIVLNLDSIKNADT
jgi:purine-nucleoside phosphorylase